MKYKFRICLIFLLCLGVNSLSFASQRSADWQGIESGQLAWNKYFSGKALITDDISYYESQMNIDHQKCGAGAKLILSSLSDYRSHIVAHQTDLAEQSYKIIRHTMEGAAKSECNRAYKAAYAVGSAFLPFWLNEDPSHLQKSVSNYGVESYVFRNFYELPIQNGLKALFLFNRNKIKFLPNGHKNGVLGAYDCGTSDIYIALDQNPYDVGASLLHEISHLYRDKFIPIKELQKLYPARGSITTKSPIIDWRTYILVDEFLASADATFSEETVEFDFQTLDSPPFSNLLFEKFSPLKINDFSFVSPDRPLEKFIAWTHQFPHYAVLLGRLAIPDRVVSYDLKEKGDRMNPEPQEIAVQDGGPDFTKSPLDALNAYNSLLLKDYEIVSLGYLKTSLTESQKQMLKLNYRPDGDEWNDYVWAHQKYVIGPENEYIWDTAFDKPLIEFEYAGKPDPGQSTYASHWVPVDDLLNKLRNPDWQYEKYYDDVDKLFEDFDKLDSKFNGPSDQCIDFEKAIEVGQLNGYLGTHVRLGNGAKTDDGDIKPGNGGKTGTPIQPGNGGKTGKNIKPGNGGKTGTDIKPGNGAKTSLTVRPCIVPPEKL